MTKRYFEKPCVSVVRLTDDIIATSIITHPTPGNGIPQAPGRAGAPHRSIWD